MTTFNTPTRYVHNVTFELPNLVIALNQPSKPSDGPLDQVYPNLWEFALDDRGILGLTLEQIKEKYPEDGKTHVLYVDYVDRTERDGEVSLFHPHVFLVRQVSYPQQRISEQERDNLYTALAYKVVAEMEMYLRQSIWRQADPGIRGATLRCYNGKILARTLSGEFLPGTR